MHTYFRNIKLSSVYEGSYKLSDCKMPKLKYKGNYIDFQRVRAKKKPKIQVVDSQANPNAEPEPPVQKEAFLAEDANRVREPEFTMQIITHDGELEDFDGFNLNYSEAMGVVYTLAMPMLVTGKFINMHVSQHLVALNAGKTYAIKFRLPLELVPERTEAIFLTQTRSLRIRVYFKLPDEEKDEGLDGNDAIFDGVNGNIEGREASTTENLLERNIKKLQEHQIEIKSDLLNDIF